MDGKKLMYLLAAILVFTLIFFHSLFAGELKIQESPHQIELNDAAEFSDGLDHLRKANILLITVDTLRYDRVAENARNRTTAPNIINFSKTAVVFDNYRVHAPWTQPSLASLFTSLYPRDHGLRLWKNRLKNEHTTLTEVLKGNGYATIAYVSHLVLTKKYGFGQGFDVFDDSILDKGHPHNVVSSKYLTDNAIDSLQNITQPFFMWVHYFDPHFEYINHDEFDFPGDWPRDRYDSEVAYTDYHINRLLDEVRKKKLLNNTIIVFTADHGEEFRDHGGLQHTTTLYEELIHVPLILYVPGFDPEKINDPVVEIDVAPTLLALVELPVPMEFTGNPIPFDKNGFKPEEKTLYVEANWKVSKAGIMEGGRKLVLNLENNKTELYDLNSDPLEKNNIVSTEKETAVKLEEKLRKFLEKPTEKPENARVEPDTEEKLRSLGYL